MMFRVNQVNQVVSVELFLDHGVIQVYLALLVLL